MYDILHNEDGEYAIWMNQEPIRTRRGKIRTFKSYYSAQKAAEKELAMKMSVDASDSRDIYTRIQDGDYKNKLPYESRSKNPEAYKAYIEEDARVLTKFRADVLADLGLTNHPKANKLYDLAWERGHSSGYYEVYGNALDLATLLED